MLSRITSRLGYANVVATLALFIALGGGAYAAFRVPPDSVGPAQLKNGAVTPPKVAKTTLAQFRGQRGPRGPRGPKGATGLHGLAGVNGNGPVYYYIGGGAIPGGNVDTAVLDVQPPAGVSYLLNASVLDSTSGLTAPTEDELECSLGVGTSPQVARFFGGGEATAPPGNAQESFGLTGAAKVTTGQHVYVVCRDGSDKNGTPGSASVWLTATRVTGVIEP
jgi:hypothetical protein